MDSLNFTIDGHLGLPGFVRVPPPFGTPRDAVRAIKAVQAGVLGNPPPEKMPSDDGRQEQWRLRLTVLAIGTACTVAAALAGWHTGQHRRPVTHIDQAALAAIAQPPAPTVVPESLPVETAENAPVSATQPAALADNPPAIAPAAPAVAQSPVKPAKPRTLARAAGRTTTATTAAHRAVSAYEEPKPVETYRAMTDTAPIISSYLAPGTSVRIELQRHTRLTD